MTELRDADGSGRLLPVFEGLTGPELHKINCEWLARGKEIKRLQEQVKAQQAQIKGLVGALEDCANFAGCLSDLGNIGPDVLRISITAINTLPASFLERERAREAVIDRFREVVNTAAVTAESIRLDADSGEIELTDWGKLLPVVEALEALEGGE